MIVRLYADADSEPLLTPRLPRPDGKKIDADHVEYEWYGLNQAERDQLFQVFDEYWSTCHRLEYIHHRIEYNERVP